jgi:thymidine phosphorylase
VDLITASILSKKLAAGLQGLVLDVKVGSGAFMKSEAEAVALARALVDVANGAGCPTAALITDMDEPLAPALGNAVEVAVCMEVLSGNRAAAPRLQDLTIALGARLLALHGEDEAKAAGKLKDAIASGQAMSRFSQMIALMGGPPDMAEDWRTHLPSARVIGDVAAPKAGYISAIDGEALGLAVVALGGGRKIESDRINPAVGLTDVVNLAAKVAQNQPLCTIHAASDEAAEVAAQAILGAITIGEKPDLQPLVRERIS